MTSYEFIDKLWDIFTNDSELTTLLGVATTDDASYADKFRERDRDADEFDADNLPCIAFYFADANTTKNDFMNLGILRIDIYADSRDNTTAIRRRIVELIHDTFDERIRAEGQRISGIKDVYKYRLEFTPLILS